ncbi:MAG: type II CAAX endopeptidase family protein [Candidatus Saccharimonadales bacterium]|jgi:membrane protease YdiL (CAAX protease family)
MSNDSSDSERLRRSAAVQERTSPVTLSTRRIPLLFRKEAAVPTNREVLDGAEQNSTAAWGPRAAIFYSLFIFIAAQVGVVFALFFVYQATGHSAQQAEAWFSHSISAQFLFILCAELLTIAGVVWFVRRRRGNLAQLGIDAPKVSYIFRALAGFGVYFFAFFAVAILAKTIMPDLNVEQEQDIGFDTAHTTIDLVLTFCSLVILPPLAEEVLFRGFLYGGLRRALPFVVATALTSLIFAAGHLLGGKSGEPLLWIAGIDTFVLSWILCTVREKTGSILPGILIHAMKNLLAFSVLFLRN